MMRGNPAAAPLVDRVVGPRRHPLVTDEQSVKVRAYRARLRLRKFIQGWLGLAESEDPSHYI